MTLICSFNRARGTEVSCRLVEAVEAALRYERAVAITLMSRSQKARTAQSSLAMSGRKRPERDLGQVLRSNIKVALRLMENPSEYTGAKLKRIWLARLQPAWLGRDYSSIERFASPTDECVK